jgi:hypothetical protein
MLATSRTINFDKTNRFTTISAMNYEDVIEADAKGSFIEVYPIEADGKRGDLALSIWVATSEGETFEQGILTAKEDLNDPAFCLSHGLEGEELEKMRKACQWLENQYIK